MNFIEPTNDPWPTQNASPRLWLTNLALVTLGCLLLALCRAALRSSGNIEHFIGWALAGAVVYVTAVVLVTRARAMRSTFLLVLVFAVLLRLAILFAPPYLSDDVYRYVWDGRVQASGINPYRYIPAEPQLAHLRDAEIYPRINRREYARTIYPPVAQMIFFVVTRFGETVTVMKAAMVGFEVVAVWALVLLLAGVGLPPQRVLLYAWHPLILWEIAGSGHCDAIAIAFIALALVARQRGRAAWAGAALAGAALVKLYPIVLLPSLHGSLQADSKTAEGAQGRRGAQRGIREGDDYRSAPLDLQSSASLRALLRPLRLKLLLQGVRWRMLTAFAATMLLAYAPYLSVGLRGVLGFLPDYTGEEGLSSGQRFFGLSLLRLAWPGAPQAVYSLLAAAILGGLGLWALLRRERNQESFLTPTLALAAAFALLLSPRYPWYFTWLAPLLCFVGRRAWAPLTYLTTASFILYRGWLHDDPASMLATNCMLYLPTALLAAFALWRNRAPAQTQ